VTTLAELRSIVRTQTQTDAADLPDSTIDVYLQQGFERTINAETRWPFYAETWDLTLDPGTNMLTLPGNVAESGIMALTDGVNGVRLGMVPQVWAEDRFVGGNGATLTAGLYSVWGEKLYLWPQGTHAEARSYKLRGYRTPMTWLTPEGSPDCDQRLHLPLTHFAAALAYAQQEDGELEQMYMARWLADVEIARQAIMDPIHQRPLVMAGAVGYACPPSNAWTFVSPSVVPPP
jgi:hypothetical protein